MKSIPYFILFFLLFGGAESFAALAPDSIYRSNIKSVRLYKYGDQVSIPVINLKSGEKVELHFDDMDADVKSYYYTYVLCDYRWQPAPLGSFGYIKGFAQNRINDYRFSSVALTRYTHYSALLPERNSYPMKSGNYLVLVYLDGDTSNVAFTTRLMVVESKSVIAGKVSQPKVPKYFDSHQKVDFSVDLKGLNNFNAPRQVHVVVLQNARWGNAKVDVQPAFVRGMLMEFNSPLTCLFPGRKEWRWLDIRDFHLQSDRVLRAQYHGKSTDIYLKSDFPLEGERYIYYLDMNGRSVLEAIRGINPHYEGDYATVHFSFIPPGGVAYPNKNIYLFGQLTHYNLNDSIRMDYNPAKGVYETDLYMKQGYYDYGYLLVDKNAPSSRSMPDGNYYETENLYTVLVYYRPFAGRHDELIGVATFSSNPNQRGVSF